MARREIDGFEVISDVELTGEDFYEPVLRVRRLDSVRVETPPYPISQDVERRTSAEAQAMADAWLAGLQYVKHNGDEWDIY